MIRAHRVNATAQDDASLITGWNVSPNVSYTVTLIPGAASCGVLLYDEDNALVASGAALVGTDQPCILTPNAATIGVIDAELGWHLLLTTTGTESARVIRIGPAVDLPDEIHPVYADDNMALARATAGIDAAAHYIDDIAVTCPLGLGAGLGDVASVPVDGTPVVGQVESVTWTATPDGTSEQAVIRRHVAIAPEAFIESVVPTPPSVADDTGTTDANTSMSGNVLTNDDSGLTVVAVNGLLSLVGTAVDGTNGGVFTIADDGDWSFDPDGDFDSLTGEATETTSVMYCASDGVAEACASLTITVSAPASGALWTPAQISGAVWVDADTATLDGSAIITLTDKVGGVITATQGTSTARPTLVSGALNGHAVMQFDGGDWLSFGTALGRPTDWTVFVVAMQTNVTKAVIGSSDSTANTTRCWGNIESNAGKLLYRFGDGSAYRYGVTDNVVITQNNWFCACSTFAAGGPTPLMFVNGTPQAVGTTAGTAINCGGTAYDFSIGRLGAYSGINMANGSRILGAVIVPGASIDTATRQRLEGFYMHKAGLTSLLPLDHPYKATPPTV